MAAPSKVYDGHMSVVGMDAYTDAAELNVSTVSKAINRQFRCGINRTRPAFRNVQLIFNNKEDEEIFRFGNLQGVCAYQKVRAARQDGIVVSIAGTIFFVVLVNETGYVYRVFTGNNPLLMQSWMIQAEEWVYAQDGEQRPVFWNGVEGSSSRRALDTEMPIGTVMAYGQGRVHVSNAYNQIISSDIMYGTGFTNTENVQKFTEVMKQANGGYFTLPIFLGTIGGMTFLPVMGLNNRGQGPLLVLGTRGAISIDVGRPRMQWIDSPPDRIELMGRGCIAPDSVVNVNGDPWFKSDDGISAYLATASDESRKTTLRKISRPVSNWLSVETGHLRRYASAVYFDNRVISTVQPQVATAKDDRHGLHRFFRGLVVADLDSVGGDGLSGLNWDGLWTGIRPTALTKVDIAGAEHCFAFSFDSDGQNRLYEITKEEANDNGKKQIESSYVTRRLSYRETGSAEFRLKRLGGGAIWLSEVRDEIQAEIDYRADHYQIWQNLMPEIQFGNKNPVSISGIPISRQREKKVRFPTPSDECREGTDGLTNSGYQFQASVKLLGCVRVDRMRLMAMATPTETESVDGSDCEDDKPEKAIEGKTEGDFTYSIV